MSIRQPIRTLLLAGVLIATAVAVRNHFENDLPAPPVEDEMPSPVIRVARDTSPTIVESNEDWLDATWLDATSDRETLDAASPLSHPEIPELPARTPANVLIR